MSKKIVMGSDHGGFSLKEKIKSELEKAGNTVVDSGTYSKESCDYPVFGFVAAKEVSSGRADRGIVICKSGIGMSIVANKMPGVRAALCLTRKDAVSSREHNDANVLVLSASNTTQKDAVSIVKAWLKTKFLKGRHKRRVDQIKEMEKQIFKLVN